MSQLTTPGVRYRQVPDRPGYRVGDDGSVWSQVKQRRGDRLFLGEWKLCTASPQSNGHMTVWLGRRWQRFVHRLVLEAFVGPCPEGMECRHLDGNPANNKLDNLKWGTRKENQDDSKRHGTHWASSEAGREHARHLWDHVEHKGGEKHHRAKLSDEQVAIVKATVDPMKRDGTATRLAKEWNVSHALIRMIARGIRRNTG